MVTEMTCTGVRGLSNLSVGTLLIAMTMSMPDETFKGGRGVGKIKIE